MLKTDNHDLPQLCTFNTAIMKMNNCVRFLGSKLATCCPLVPFCDKTRPLYSMNCNWEKNYPPLKCVLQTKEYPVTKGLFEQITCVILKNIALKLNLCSTYRTPWNRILSSFAKKHWENSSSMLRDMSFPQNDTWIKR